VTFRLPFGPHPCNAFALIPGFPFSWPATLQPLCLGRKPKARVATFIQLSPSNIFACDCGHRLDAFGTFLACCTFKGQQIATHDAI